MVAKYVPPHLRRQQADAGAAGRPDPDDDRGPSLGGGRFGDSAPQERSSWRGGGSAEGAGRFDCLKEDFGSGRDRDTGKGRGGFGRDGRDRFGDSRSRGRDFGDCDGEWFQRRDGRKANGWDLPSEFAVFGEKRTNTGINFDEYDKIPVQVSGRDCDASVKIDTFSEARLSAPLQRNLERCGYERPTPVQKHAIPIVCEGRDVMACAQTGSGKTCAFMVPAIECLLRSGPPPTPPDNGRTRRPSMPCVLVMAPTRELSSQIFDEARKFAYATGIRCCVVYGGADMREQRRELGSGCDVLVATPGRLTDMFERGSVSLACIQFLILDEADRMLDMGFEPQVRQIVERTDMGSLASRARQSMMFSATFPRDVQMLATDFLTDYVFLTVGRVGAASELVEQMLVYSEEREKVRDLERLLQDERPRDGLALIFVETKRGADTLDRDLYDAGWDTCAIHGDRSQTEREQALSRFRSGRSPIMIATDVASRGLDIPNVHVVVNFDMPKSIDDYVHRIGRTGRAGNKGKAIAFINRSVPAPLLRDLRDSLEDANQDWPDWFEDMCRSTRFGGGGGGKGRKGRGGGGPRFGGRDFRIEGRKGGGGGGGGFNDRRGGGGQSGHGRFDDDRW